MSRRLVRILVIAGLGALVLVCCVSTATNAAFTHPVACDNVAYYQSNYALCDNESDDYAPWFWIYHHNYYVYVNDDMDYPRYHPVGWYTSQTFYQTRYYRTGSGGTRITNYHVNTSPARARYGGGGRSSGGTGRFGGGGRGSCCHGSGGYHGKP